MARLGRQTPTKSAILPYEKTKGQEAVEAYRESGKEAMEWQQLLLFDLLLNDRAEMVHRSTKIKPEIIIIYGIKKLIDYISFKRHPTYISKNGRLYGNRFNVWSDD